MPGAHVRFSMYRSAPSAAVKQGVRAALSSCYYGLGLHAFSPRGRVLVLMYHRVLRDSDPLIPNLQPGIYVTRSSFERQVQYLLAHYKILSFPDLLSAWNRGSLDARVRYCVLTFDDGWEDTFSCAFPVLRWHRVPATIFLATSYIGSSQWFWTDRLSYLLACARRAQLSPTQRRDLRALADTLNWADLPAFLGLPPDSSRGCVTRILDGAVEAFKTLPSDRIEHFLDRFAHTLEAHIPNQRVFLSWDEVCEMSEHGMSFGSHTVTHPILTNIQLQQVDQELGNSLETLRSKPIASLPVFCYPNGSYNETIKDRVKAAGYVAAVTVDCGTETKQPRDLFAIRRLGIHQDVTRTPALFSLHLSELLTSHGGS